MFEAFKRVILKLKEMREMMMLAAGALICSIILLMADLKLVFPNFVCPITEI